MYVLLIALANADLVPVSEPIVLTVPEECHEDLCSSGGTTCVVLEGQEDTACEVLRDQGFERVCRTSSDVGRWAEVYCTVASEPALPDPPARKRCATTSGMASGAALGLLMVALVRRQRVDVEQDP